MSFSQNSPKTIAHCTNCPVLGTIECWNAYYNAAGGPLGVSAETRVVSGPLAIDLWDAGFNSEGWSYLKRTNASLYWKSTSYLTISPTTVTHGTTTNLTLTWSFRDPSDEFTSAPAISVDQGVVNSVTYVNGYTCTVNFTSSGVPGSARFADSWTGLFIDVPNL